MAKTKAELLHEIKILKHNLEVKTEQCERCIQVNTYLCDLLKEKGITDKQIIGWIEAKDKGLWKEVHDE